jgi:predicted DNA-binding transcriptional regulator AlpA
MTLVRRPLNIPHPQRFPTSATQTAATQPTPRPLAEPYIPGFERTQRAPAPVTPPATPPSAQRESVRHDEPFLPGFEPLLTPAQCARLIGVSTSTLQTWRALGTGPQFVKFSRRTVRYTRAALTAWLGAKAKA